MPRPVTLFTGQWADLSLADLAAINAQVTDLQIRVEITDKGLKHLSNLPNIEKLSLLFGRGISDKGLEHLSKVFLSFC